ncbi:hypothetical protein [Pseudooceanicola sp.]|uniref:hypothetical protein n=1 Tax=Pseudooceanicola sp. TaxID=1914328 RepID=UPI00262EA5DF|nr:hypothetical protein [Pseudooceanicola sp.]MDF1856516.1 hypothetical protein [Pseudooceanicola sp.]
MSAAIRIPAGGGDDLHVFALALEGDRAAGFIARPQDSNGAGWPLKVALAADHLNPEGIEDFEAADLVGVGLAHYLSDGLGADAARLAGDSDRLDAQTGHIVILRPAAFDGIAQTLKARAPLTHLGSYAMAAPTRTMERLRSRSADGGLSGGAAPAPTLPSRRWARLVVLAAALLVLGLLILATGGFR